MFRHVRRCVFPADDDVAVGGVVAVALEIFALEFKFNADMLPLAGAQFAFGFAVGEAGLHALHAEAETAGHDAEEENYALLVHRRVGQAAQRQRRSQDRTSGARGYRGRSTGAASRSARSGLVRIEERRLRRVFVSVVPHLIANDLDHVFPSADLAGVAEKASRYLQE